MIPPLTATIDAKYGLHIMDTLGCVVHASRTWQATADYLAVALADLARYRQLINELINTARPLAVMTCATLTANRVDEIDAEINPRPRKPEAAS